MDQNPTIRPLQPDSDFDQLVSLYAVIEAADQVDVDASAEGLRREFAWRGHQPQYDRWVVPSSDDPRQLVAHAWIFHQSAVRSILHVAVHPDFRRRGIGSALLQTAIARGREMGATQIVAGAAMKTPDGDAFLTRNGFKPVGHNRHMVAPAFSNGKQPVWPPGFTLRTLAELAGDVSYVVRASNACYTDMWGHGENTVPATVESYTRSMDEYPDHYDPDGMFLLFSPENEIAGICFGRIETVYLPGNPKVIDSPGVVPAFRHLDLQRPLVLATMRWLDTQAEGDYHLLTWGDSEKAAAIYEDIGFVLNQNDYSVEYLLNLKRPTKSQAGS